MSRAPTTPAPATEAAPPAKSSAAPIIVVAVVMGLLLVGAAGAAYFLFFRHRGGTPTAEQMVAGVQRALANPALGVSDLSTSLASTDSDHAEIDYHASAVLKDPLFESVDGTEVLKNDLNLDPEAWAKARSAVSGKEGAHILELAGLKGVDDSLLTTVYLKQVAAPGLKFPIAGHLKATRSGGAWQVDPSGPPPKPALPAGQARAKFSGPTAVVSDATEMGKLRELAKTQADLPAKVEQGRQALVEEHKANLDKAVAQLADELAPGTLFAGTATGSGSSERLWLEITRVQADGHQIFAALRNSGGWLDQRPFRGTYGANPDDGTLTVTLTTQRNQMVKKAGPFLDRNEGWQIIFTFADGKLTGHSGEFDYRFTKLAAAQATSARSELDGEADMIRMALGAGKVFRGTVKPKAGGDGLELELRFNRLDADGSALGLVVTTPSHPAWQRAFRGTIIGNSFRDEGWPIHLETAARDYVKSASGNAILSTHEGFDVSLKLADGRLVGSSRDFNWEFVPVSTEAVTKQDADLATLKKQIFALVKSGTSYSGKAHADGSDDSERVRLRFTMVDQRSGLVEALLESQETSGLNREFKGGVDLQDGKLMLPANGHVRGRPGRAVHLPAFVDGTADASLSLTTDGDKLIVEVLPSGWVLELH
ncbi:MAG TPA: hypothetical protein VHD32_12650 [Candidatus Didemnitutus sp.]|nr:hypothetical protein [Candidatus Didemnitutus sp.]